MSLLTLLGAGNTGSEWTPDNISEADLYVPGYRLFRMFTDDAKTVNATGAGDEIFHIDEVMQGFDVDAEASTRRPFLQSDGSLLFGNITTIRAMRVQNSIGSFNYIHTLGIGTILVRFKLNNVGESGMLMDNGGFQGGGGQLNGFSFLIDTLGRLRFIIDRQSVVRPLDITTTATVSDTNVHTAVVRLGGTGTNQISVQLDGNTPTAGTPNTALGTGNAQFNLSIGARNISWPSSNFTGRVYDAMICRTLISEENIARFKAFSPTLG